jgi:hypothetical protein
MAFAVNRVLLKGESMRIALTLALLLLASYAISAQTPKPSPAPEEGTKLEKFQARTGAVIIKGYTRVGFVTGTGGRASVLSMEFTDAQSSRKEKGIVIEVTESGRLERSNRSYIDYDEIDSLVQGIDYIGKIQGSVTTQANFEASYKTRGDFSVTTFNTSSGDLNVAVTSGRIGQASVYLELGDLPKFRDLIVQAKAKLEGPRQ